MDQHQALYHLLLDVRTRPSEQKSTHRLEAMAVRRQNARNSRRAAAHRIAARFVRIGQPTPTSTSTSTSISTELGYGTPTCRAGG